MTDYIERETAIEICYAPDIDKDYPRMDIAARLHDLTAADVRPKWISVEERLPKDLQTVLVLRKDGMMYIWMFCAQSPTDEMWVDEYANSFSVYDTTHWMPLPEPPNCGVKMEAGE